jgi:hypothetical protein
MARNAAPDDRHSLTQPPSEVQVAVVPGPRSRHRRGGRLDTSSTLMALLVLTALVSGGALVVGKLSAPETARRAGAAQLSAEPSIAAAYRYPLGCLETAIGRGVDRQVDRGGPCWRYGIYVTAIFHRDHGVWRLALEATSASCPFVSLPPSVRAQVAVCRAHAAPAAHHG